MGFFITLLLGGFVAAAWLRIDKLERRIAELSRAIGEQRLEPQAPKRPDDQQDAPARPAMAAQRIGDAPLPQQAIPAAPEVGPEPELQPAMTAGLAAFPDDAAAPSPRGFSFDFEDIFGRRLPIWGGGFALAIAGIFLVRFSIEAGLLTPIVRVGLSFVFGLALLAGAETAYRFDARLAEPRVRQALAGAGLATLYGAFYLAGTTYGLIGAGAAFVGLASVTAAAIGLSFRFGLPSAVIGLVGGFAAPLLVGSDSANVPLLSFYLALITGALAWSGEVQKRSWLSYAALAAGLGWGLLMMIAGVSTTSDIAAVGLYLLVLGTVLPAFLQARGGPGLPHLIAGALASLQMAALVSDAGFAPLTWGLYLLIGAALAGLGWRFEALRLGTMAAAGLGLGLLAIWTGPEPRFFALVAGAQVAFFAGVALAHHAMGRARLLDLVQLSAVSLIMAIVVYARFGSGVADTFAPLLAAATAGLALLPAIGFALLWRRGQERETPHTLILLAPAALLAFGALLLVTPAWLAPVMALAASVPLLWCEWRRDAPALHSAAWAGAAVTVLALTVTPGFAPEFTQLGDLAEPVDLVPAVLRWAAAATPFAAMAMMARGILARSIGEALAVMLGYGVISQALPSEALAWIAAVAGIGLLLATPRRIAAWVTAFAIAAAWTLVPLAGWATGGVLALLGEPFMVTSAIGPRDLALRITPILAALAAMMWRGPSQRIDLRAAALLALGVIAIVALHSLYKQIFAISTLAGFDQFGMAERSIWQAMMVGAAFASTRLLPQDLCRPVSFGLVAASLAHFALFTLLLHNPLWSEQQVGALPVLNWLALAYVAAMTGIWIAGRQWQDAPAAVRTGGDATMMGLIVPLAYSLLRQIFAGTVLTAIPIGQTESLLISLLGILVALGFLWWGSWRAVRSWRIGSLVLMLAAVIKVFLIDAAGLEGLLRIASFMALGFSLIGIGWVYSRQLSRSAGEGQFASHPPADPVA